MKSNDFVLNGLKSLSEKFTNQLFEYHYCNQTNAHIVRVDSQKLYDSNDFKIYESKFWEKFITDFSTEELLFVSDSNDFNFIQEPYNVILDGLVMDSSTYIEYKESLNSTTSNNNESSDSFSNGTISYEETCVCESDINAGYNNYALAA
jgi:hypothetical protein